MDTVDHNRRQQSESKAYFVIPAYNEAENIKFLFNNIQRFMLFFEQPYHVILINDGSTDDTVSEVEKFKDNMPITLRSFEKNIGPGKAFLTGFETALAMAQDDDMVVTIEADNTSDLCPLYKMFEQCRRGYDLVLASVYGEGKVVGAPLHRKILSRCANIMMQVVFRLSKVNTFTSFFRVYKVSMLRDAHGLYRDRLIEESGFICMLELLVKLHSLKYEITQVPMLLDSKIRAGKSKMKSFKNIKDTLRFTFKYFINNKAIIISLLHDKLTVSQTKE